jgi:glyoxylase-like metal-dependent hydrolase (beta-lactamase superfamily II)
LGLLGFLDLPSEKFFDILALVIMWKNVLHKSNNTPINSMAESFKDAGAYSFVYQQPKNQQEIRAATQALLSCPTGSIGTRACNNAKEVMADFPLPIAPDGVHYCGFNSPKSYGGNSFFVKHKDGNWLIDSPKYLPHLIKKFEELGGIQYIFLTHRDDVAEAARYANHFGSKRIIHKAEVSAQPESEVVIEGIESTQFTPEFIVLPVPGHTAGHMVLLYKSTYLFTGDHLAYDPESGELDAYKDYCWYSWHEQTVSMKRLLNFLKTHQCEWVLAGHGHRIQFPRNVMLSKLNNLVQRMEANRD